MTKRKQCKVCYSRSDTMATMSFASIEGALPEELVDHIICDVILDVFSSLLNSTVKVACENVDSTIHDVAQNVSDVLLVRNTSNDANQVQVKVDDYMDWYTIVFVFPKTSRFALFHHFAEWQTCDQFLIDGFFTHDTFHIERYLHVDSEGEHHTNCDDIHTITPFTEIVPNISNYSFDLSACGQKIWKNPVDILLAFNKVEYGEE